MGTKGVQVPLGLGWAALLVCTQSGCKSRGFISGGLSADALRVEGFTEILARAEGREPVLAVTLSGDVHYGLLQRVAGDRVTLTHGFTRRRGEAATRPPASRLDSVFLLESGVQARGWFLRDDADTLRIVDTNCGTPVLQKRSVQTTALVVHGVSYKLNKRMRLVPASFDALSTASLENLPDAWTFGFSRSEARSLLVAGEGVTFRTSDGRVAEGTFVVAQPGCLLLEDATGAYRGYPVAGIDLDSLRSTAATSTLRSSVPASRKEAPFKSPAPGWPGIKEHTRTNGYIADRIFKSYRAEGRKLPAQGFKLTIAAADSTFEHVASVVLPALVRRRAAHTVVERFSDFLKEGQTRQVGKLVTIYPQDLAEAASIASELESLLAMNPPVFWAIQGEHPVGKNQAVYGIVTTRFGAFTWEHGGDLKRPDGRLVPELRGTQWKPEWVKDPF